MTSHFQSSNNGPLLKDLTFGGEHDDPNQCMWFIGYQNGSYSRCSGEKEDEYFCIYHYDKYTAISMRETVNARRLPSKA